MQYLLSQLEQDHQRILRMMYLLSKEIKRVTGLEKGTPNYDRILEILDYIQVYPEVWHHPTEDVLFEQLLSKDHVNTVAVQKLLNDHPSLEALSSELSIMYSELSATAEPPTLSLLRLSRYYCSKQISHIHDERSIFAAISARFDDQDWQAVGVILQRNTANNDDLAQFDYISRSEDLNQAHVLTSCGLH
jgi:hemerythrin-like domain-containing protein